MTQSIGIGARVWTEGEIGKLGLVWIFNDRVYHRHMRFAFRVMGLVLIILPSPAHAVASKDCVERVQEILTSSEAGLSANTDRLIAYLGQLVERHMIGDVELSRFLEALERERVSNPITAEQAETSSKLLIHREGLERIVQGNSFDLRRLEEWTQRALEVKGVVRVKREEVRNETQEINRKITFVPIRPGRFQMGWPGEKGEIADVTLTHPFEVMSTLVTQEQWVDVMGENPSEFADGEDSITVTVNGKDIKMQPNNPVENVTWWSVLVYANRLSEKRGLKPAYDLGQIKFRPDTRAENGTLVSWNSNGFRVNAPNGDIYETEGYRLPTEAEQEYLLHAAGTSNGAYHFGDSEADLKDYAWYLGNSNQTTHPVAQLKPLLIDGKAIYDLPGNVWEWSQDNWYSDPHRAKLTNPTGAAEGAYRVLRGGGWAEKAEDLQSTCRFAKHPEQRDGSVGFRLVRTK